jgi:hypothetical protein
MIFHLFSRRTLPLVAAKLLKHGFVSHTLDGRSVHDEGSFLRAVSPAVASPTAAPLGDSGPS